MRTVVPGGRKLTSTLKGSVGSSMRSILLGRWRITLTSTLTILLHH